MFFGAAAWSVFFYKALGGFRKAGDETFYVWVLIVTYWEMWLIPICTTAAAASVCWMFFLCGIGSEPAPRISHLARSARRRALPRQVLICVPAPVYCSVLLPYGSCACLYGTGT